KRVWIRITRDVLIDEDGLKIAVGQPLAGRSRWDEFDRDGNAQCSPLFGQFPAQRTMLGIVDDQKLESEWLAIVLADGRLAWKWAVGVSRLPASIVEEVFRLGLGRHN